MQNSSSSSQVSQSVTAQLLETVDKTDPKVDETWWFKMSDRLELYRGYVYMITDRVIGLKDNKYTSDTAKTYRRCDIEPVEKC